MVTIKDIAKKLGLNFSTVSRALNNKPGVSDKTRKLVVETAKKMGYRPNTIARGLVSRSTKTIAVIFPDILNPVFGEITTGIIETANENDYDVFLCISNWDSKKELDFIHAVQQKQVDGIIINFVDNDNAAFFEKNSIPAVGFESWLATKSMSSVSTDNFKGGYLAAEHLMQAGYKHPAVISGPTTSAAALERNEGFSQACLDHGLDFTQDRIYVGRFDITSGYELTQKLLADHPGVDSIFSNNDVIGLGVLDYLDENKVQVGKEMGVIGFDNIRISGLRQIQLTSLNQPKEGIGRILANLLFQQIQNDRDRVADPPKRILLEPSLIRRMTTDKG
ncbi:MAG: LacI family DNA-binding transcriptional regulator [Sphaerochaeta sp.]|nr:LacI family DNA-binding transcriptional regulator [Sphaerochaeta sp.]